VRVCGVGVAASTKVGDGTDTEISVGEALENVRDVGLAGAMGETGADVAGTDAQPTIVSKVANVLARRSAPRATK
jgi:hypothetical protein